MTEPDRADATPLPVAVIGAGFSGTMAAIQLLARLSPGRGVLLCERAERFGPGRAYATGNPDHLLNVRAANMSAYPDRPGHFTDWLAGFDERVEPGIRVTPAGTFAARGLYGRYLAELLTGAVTGADALRLRLVNDAIIDIRQEDGRLSLHSAGGRTYAAAGAVLAMGNLVTPAEPPSRYRFDPWRSDAFARLHPHLPVMIVGTGLTMVDAVMTLRRHGFEGRIVALSRRGLVPAVHAPAASSPPPVLSARERTSLSALCVRIRTEVEAAVAAGTDWRGVIDALRPVTDQLWLGLPEAERGRFLRHLRPFWDVHRHRSAPPAGAAIAEAIADGRLVVRAGRIVAIADGPGHARVTFRPRGTEARETLDVQGILDARGIGTVAGTQDPQLSRLIARGLVRPGPFGIGLDAAADLSLRRDAGAPEARLWTLGPLLRGVFWECTAVPDIRNQAAALAAAVAAALP